MRKSLYILFALLLLVATESWASKAMSIPFRVTLADGRQTTVRLCGDEHFSFFASSEGELIIREGNIWRVASEAEMLEADKSIAKVRMRVGEGIYATRPFPHVGTPKALVIMASFSDQDFTYSKEQVEGLFNGTECYPEATMRSYSSLAQYMDDMSEGKFRPQFDVVGPYKLNGTVEDYGKNSGSSDCNYRQFLKDCCAAADADVDFADYDQDGDGYVDLVYVVYAGFGENWTGEAKHLWPKSGTGDYGTYDGKKVNRYGINNEIAGRPSMDNVFFTGIGVLAHEFCHTLGLPDVYPTANWSDVTKYDNQSMEYWDLMDNGENNYNGFAPTPLTAFERELFGWIEIETLSEPSDIVLTPLQDGGKAYRVMNDNDATGNEYYILESIPNDSESGWYYKMRGNGMLITHINYDTNYFGNFSNPNNVQGKPRWTIVPADGIVMTSYRLQEDSGSANYITSKQYREDHAGDTYPGLLGVTDFYDYKAWTGTVDKPITNITQDGAAISFKFMGGANGGQPEFQLGDANIDGSITMADANLVVNKYVNGDAPGLNFETADVNEDGEITMSDANSIVNLFLGVGTEE